MERTIWIFNFSEHVLCDDIIDGRLNDLGIFNVNHLIKMTEKIKEVIYWCSVKVVQV